MGPASFWSSTLVPLVGLIVLLAVNGKATGTLQQHRLSGWLRSLSVHDICKGGVLDSQDRSMGRKAGQAEAKRCPPRELRRLTLRSTASPPAGGSN